MPLDPTDAESMSPEKVPGTLNACPSVKTLACASRANREGSTSTCSHCACPLVPATVQRKRVSLLVFITRLPTTPATAPMGLPS